MTATARGADPGRGERAAREEHADLERNGQTLRACVRQGLDKGAQTCGHAALRRRAVPPAHDRPAPVGSTPAPPPACRVFPFPSAPTGVSLPAAPPAPPSFNSPSPSAAESATYTPGGGASHMRMVWSSEHDANMRSFVGFHATELTLPAPWPGSICRRRPDSRCHVYTFASGVKRRVSKVLEWMEGMEEWIYYERSTHLHCR